MLDLVLDRTASDEAEQPPVVADPRKSPEDRAANRSICRTISKRWRIGSA